MHSNHKVKPAPVGVMKENAGIGNFFRFKFYLC